MTEIKLEPTITDILQKIRFDLTKVNLTKSGHNNFQGFDYYEEDDILPTITELCFENGVCPIFTIDTDPKDGREYAYLTLYKGLEKITQKLPTAEPNGKDPIQCAGAKFTYMERYSYMKLFCICEPDSVDGQDSTKTTKQVERKCTNEQIDIIVASYDEENIKKILDYYKVKELKDLTLKQASTVIAKKRANNG